jgi:hypothetical protein
MRAQRDVLAFAPQIARNRQMDVESGKAEAEQSSIVTANREQKIKAADGFRQEMEALALKARDLILAQPPIGFLGYVLSQLNLAILQLSTDEGKSSPQQKAVLKTYQLVLEYMHAVWSCHANLKDEGQPVDESKAGELMEVFSELDTKTMLYCMASAAARIGDGAGGHSADTEFHAKSSWSLIRGHRYQVLEEEFFRFALEPHSDALKEAYGVDHNEVAVGIQRIADAFRTGVSKAAEGLNAAMERVYGMVGASGEDLGTVLTRVQTEEPEYADEIRYQMQDMLFGGVCNLSRHSGLPAALLDDLSYAAGENKDFFASGEFAGTPMRALPARSKPGIKLGGAVYATDGQFVRDSAYRAIQWGLWKRLPYRDEWLRRQGRRVEEAFPLIFAHQLREARSFESVYHKDVATGEWVECDLLLIIDDVLLVIEGKAGVMPMQSPATNFASHERTINELIGKAYKQCARFMEYLASAQEVPLFSLQNGSYVERARIRRDSFRLTFPIGLTLEAFTPFSAMAKEMPGIVPILGIHPFVSMSVDDLFVLNRFLPTTGQLIHYLSVRQQVAGMPKALLFDEIDHLGAYVSRNRFDFDLREQLKEADQVTWDAFSDTVDHYFEGEDWAEQPVPTQPIPAGLGRLLGALDQHRPTGWLRVDALLRDYDQTGRENVAEFLEQLEPTLLEHPKRRFLIANDPPLQVWLCRAGAQPSATEVQFQAQVACALSQASATEVVVLSYSAPHEIEGIQRQSVKAASILQLDYPAVEAEAARQQQKLMTPKQALAKRRSNRRSSKRK